MKTRPIVPAEIDFGTAAPGDAHAPAPRSSLCGDAYHPQVGALAQARHVFLDGNGLPQRWAARERFVVLETGFGLGHNFIATWDAWRRDAMRCRRLIFVSLEQHPPRREDLARAHSCAGVGANAHAPEADAPAPPAPAPELAQALLQAWPPLTPGLHTLDFDGGDVRLLLALGDAGAWLPQLRLQADAVFLDGFAPTHNPETWTPQLIKSVGRHAAPGCTLATWSVAGALHAALRTAGFVVQTVPRIGGQQLITQAQHAPPYQARPLPSPEVRRVPHAGGDGGFDALVVGAGLAGAAAALALAQQGLRVQVLERHAQPAQGASGNAAALFHGSVNRDDGLHTRLLRSAALHAAALHRSAIASGRVAGQVNGLLQAAAGATLAELQALAAAQALPADYVQPLDAAAASAAAGVRLDTPCWAYAQGGWLAPAEWVAWALARPGITLHTGHALRSLRRDGDAWSMDDGQGRPWRSRLVVLATGGDLAPLLPAGSAPPWPLRAVRGQVSVYRGPLPSPAAPRLPVTGEGYAIAMGDGLLFGATRQAGDTDAQVRLADHTHNLQRLQRLTGIDLQAQVAQLQGRVGWRVETDDRLPMAGAMPLWPLPAASAGARAGRGDQTRLLPRQPGLFVLSALGSRGLTLAPLLGRLVAAMACGEPWPLEQDLCDAVDPGRWIVRAARRAAREPGQAG